MERSRKLLTLAGLLWLWFGLPASAHAQFLIIGDDNKLHWDGTGKMVFTEPGKDEVVIGYDSKKLINSVRGQVGIR